MDSFQCCGSLSVCCTDNFGPAAECLVTLSDSHGSVISHKFTDCFGRAAFPVFCSDEYCVRAQALPCHSPAAQSRWFHLTPQENLKCDFVFRRCRPFGNSTLVIELRDANYPKYTLSKGVYSLWQIF